MSIQIFIALFASVGPALAAVVSQRATVEVSGEATLQTSKVSLQEAAAYEAFCEKHGRAWKPGSAEYEKRLSLFAEQRKKVEAHNAKPQKSWLAGINQLADLTREEYKAMMGYKGRGQRASRDAFSGVSLSEGMVTVIHKSAPVMRTSHPQLPTAGSSRSWKNLSAASFMRDQGGCGSCWAVAAVGAIEMHAELDASRRGESFTPRKYSYNHILDCTPNPQHCGGTGGCSGATAELAFGYAGEHGIALDSEYSSSGNCGQSQLSSSQLHLQGMSFVQLPINDGAKLKCTLFSVGPVVVSVAADTWQSYSSGVFDDCSVNATVDHAVLAVGFGRDDDLSKDYWTIRNSWGPSFGEDGYIRLLDDSQCGTDFDPKVGVGCDNGPPTLPVCGMCGMFSDSAFPNIGNINWQSTCGSATNPTVGHTPGRV